MSSSLDIDAIEVVPQGRNEFGPSDLSDSASDSVGTQSEFSDSDSNGTGDRPSVESSTAPAQTESDLAPDISPDKIVSADGEEEEEDEDQDETEAEGEIGSNVSAGGDDTFEDDELDAGDPDTVDNVETSD